MTQQSFELIVDFSSETLMVSGIGADKEIINFFSAITPNNFLEAMQVLRNNGCTIYPDCVKEVDYSALEY